MSMIAGSGNGLSTEINVTPLIDVLLVLLIIFMVIVPVTPRGLEALAPQPPRPNSSVDAQTIVVQVASMPGGSLKYSINQQDVAKSELLDKLTAIFAMRAEKVMFVKGDDGLNYETVAEVVDIGHKAGVDNVGLITPKVEAEQ